MVPVMHRQVLHKRLKRAAVTLTLFGVLFLASAFTTWSADQPLHASSGSYAP